MPHIRPYICTKLDFDRAARMETTIFKNRLIVSQSHPIRGRCISSFSFTRHTDVPNSRIAKYAGNTVLLRAIKSKEGIYSHGENFEHLV